MEKFRIASRTDVGISRQNNEDSMIAFNCSTGHVVAVCDGMGGENGGETASNLAVSIIQDILTNNHFDDPAQAIVGAMTAANRGILHRSSLTPSLAGMGSTCVMCIIKNGQVYYGSVGDSRIYYYQPGQGLMQITKDQSYVQTLVDAGEITPEEAETHPRKNEITNALGIQDMQPPMMCSAPITPVPGSYFLLCSDGLSGMVSVDMMERVLSTAEINADQKAQRLVNMANEAGGLDNITVQLIEWGTAAAAQPAAPVMPGINAPEKQPKKSSKTMLIVCILLAVAIAIGAGAYYYFSSKKKEEKKEIVVPQSSTKPATSSTSSSSNSAPATSSSPKASTPKANSQQSGSKVKKNQPQISSQSSKAKAVEEAARAQEKKRGQNPATREVIPGKKSDQNSNSGQGKVDPGLLDNK